MNTATLSTLITSASTLATDLLRARKAAEASGDHDAAAALLACELDALALWERLCALRDATAAPPSQEAA